MKCPRCGNTKITISQEMGFNQYWHIDGNKLFKGNADPPTKEGRMFISCDVCEQEEDIETEYECTKEQASQIFWGVFYQKRCADITEFMEKDFDWKSPVVERKYAMIKLIEEENYADKNFRFTAIPVDQPGSPRVGRGKTKLVALIDLLKNNNGFNIEVIDDTDSE